MALTEDIQRMKSQEANQVIYHPNAVLVSNGVAVKEYMFDTPDENGDINGLTKKVTLLSKESTEQHITF